MSALPAVSLRSISKAYPGVQALHQVDLTLEPGEIHAIVGLNGAGKSTLVRILAGLIAPDSGVIELHGTQLVDLRPWEARRRGITVVPQEVVALPSLPIGRSVMLGQERFWVRREQLGAEERRRVGAMLQRLGAGYADSAYPADLGVSELRLAQIARALLAEAQVMVLDEPTAVLPEADTEWLLARLRQLRDEGEAILYVSHRLGEVMQLADRITVLRDGRSLGTYAAGAMDREELISLMAGDEDVDGRTARVTPLAENKIAGHPVLTITGLTRAGDFSDVELEARPGQIVALVGLQGGGQSRLLACLAGLLDIDSGGVTVRGAEIRMGSVAEAIRHGVVLVPADRRSGGVVAPMSIKDNIALPSRSSSKRGIIRLLRREQQVANEYVRRFALRPASSSTLAGALSGGNQQKVAVAKALEADPVVLLLDEPTQGIDVHSKAEVLGLIRDVVRTGNRCALIASSEIEEVIDGADVVYVMRLGRIVARLGRNELDHDRILQLMVP